MLPRTQHLTPHRSASFVRKKSARRARAGSRSVVGEDSDVRYGASQTCGATRLASITKCGSGRAGTGNIGWRTWSRAFGVPLRDLGFWTVTSRVRRLARENLPNPSLGVGLVDADTACG